MLIEIYKGISIYHNAEKDDFYTDIVINKKYNGNKEYIRKGRLQQLRNEIDKFLNVASKKPVLKKAWLSDGNTEETFELVTIILYNAITKCVRILRDNGRTSDIETVGYKSDKLFIKSRENDVVISAINARTKAIEKIKKETKCSRGKLIKVELEHFK